MAGRRAIFAQRRNAVSNYAWIAGAGGLVADQLPPCLFFGLRRKAAQSGLGIKGRQGDLMGLLYRAVAGREGERNAILSSDAFDHGDGDAALGPQQILKAPNRLRGSEGVEARSRQPSDIEFLEGVAVHLSSNLILRGHWNCGPP